MWVISTPWSSTRPRLGLIRPERTPKAVLLPAPLGPTRPVTDRHGAEKPTPERASIPPNLTETSDTVRAGVAWVLLEPVTTGPIQSAPRAGPWPRVAPEAGRGWREPGGRSSPARPPDTSRRQSPRARTRSWGAVPANGGDRPG